MKYRPTPLNIICIVIIGFSIYNGIYTGPEGWGILGLIYILPIGLFGLAVDFVIQRFVKKYFWTLNIEITIIAIIFFCFEYAQRSKILIIPDNFQNKYITTIYGVDNAPKLPSGIFSWSYEIKVPANGIILTSSDIESDLPETVIKTTLGTELNTNDTESCWIQLSADNFNCNGKTYYYNYWKIDSSSCMYSTNEIDSFKINLQRQFCNQYKK